MTCWETETCFTSIHMHVSKQRARPHTASSPLNCAGPGPKGLFQPGALFSLLHSAFHLGLALTCRCSLLFQHFVSERKYDEDLGRVARFTCDLDTLKKSIGSFGQGEAVQGAQGLRGDWALFAVALEKPPDRSPYHTVYRWQHGCSRERVRGAELSMTCLSPVFSLSPKEQLLDPLPVQLCRIHVLEQPE